MNSKLSLVLVLAVILTALTVNANNLRITSGERVGNNQVKFSVAWDNSWRVSGEPSNWDAVWIFVKYRKCGLNEAWKHGLLSTNMIDHIIPASFDSDPILTAARDGSDTGNQYDFTGHNTGVMIYRSDLGKGNIPATEITLKVNGADAVTDPFDPAENYEIRVIGIEMVYVPENTFWLGEDWSGTPNEASYAYNKSNTLPPISSEDAITAGTYQSATYQRYLPASYPKGFASFYCMKYEITQGQFRNFLDTSVPVSGDAQHPEAYSGQYRNNILSNTTPDRAQNFINWDWFTTYLDWAALRPMTELEYEKACVGPIFDRTNGWYAWGTSTIIEAQYLSGTEDGTETVSTLNANCHYRIVQDRPVQVSQRPAGYVDVGWWSYNATYNMEIISSPDCESFPISTANFPNLSGSSEWQNRQWAMPVMICGTKKGEGSGPIGVGIFARDNTLTRETTGATYYGIMEMSGNVWEQCIGTMHGTAINAPDFTGVWGNGVVNAITGKCDVANWKEYSNYRALRGGSWAESNLLYLQTHDRINCNYNTETASMSVGGRGVR